MARIPGLRRAFRLATRRAAVADDVDAELAFHFDMAAAELEAGGLTPDAARLEARRRFGDVDARRAELRTIDARQDRARRVVEWGQGLAQDLRVAARALRRSPGFAAVIVLTLALGIGANSMMFGIVDRLLLRPPAYLRDADRTGRVFFTRTRGGVENTNESVGYAHFADMREGTAGALDLVGITSGETVIGDGQAARQAHVGRASGEMWQLFDARPALGRLFGPSDDALPAGSPVAVLGYEFWRRTYGGDASVLGRPLRIGGAVYTIVGVAPKGFTGVDLQLVDAWVPLTAASHSEFGTRFVSLYNMSWFGIVARRHADVSPERANALLTRAYATSLERRAAAQPPRGGRGGRGGAGASAAPARPPRAALYPILADRGPERSDGARVAVWVLGVAAIVLLVACANVANLLLARALAREREVALRVALGVGKARLARQLLAEVVLLAALGAAAGLLLARVGGALLTRVLLPEARVGRVAHRRAHAARDVRDRARRGAARVARAVGARAAARRGVAPARRRARGRGAARAHARRARARAGGAVGRAARRRGAVRAQPPERARGRLRIRAGARALRVGGAARGAARQRAEDRAARARRRPRAGDAGGRGGRHDVRGAQLSELHDVRRARAGARLGDRRRRDPRQHRRRRVLPRDGHAGAARPRVGTLARRAPTPTRSW